MDRWLSRSAKNGPSPISSEITTAGKYFAAVGNYLERRKRDGRRQVARAPKPTIYRPVPTESDLEREEREELEAWHRMVRQIAVLNREQRHFQEVVERHEVEQAISEAMGLMRTINAAYGWESGEPAVADRMFGTNVIAALGEARSSGVLTFKTKKMIDVMRSVGGGAIGGGSRLAMVAAVRNLVGGVTANEARLLEDQKRLNADDFAEYVGLADKMTRAQEKAMAMNLGRPASPETRRDVMERSLADGRRLRRNGSHN